MFIWDGKWSTPTSSVGGGMIWMRPSRTRTNPMAKPFRKLLEGMPHDRRARIEKRTREMLNEITLQELRKALELTQTQLAATLKINQAAVSKMERQSDMYISTLRRFLEAMGGSLKIVAEFPGGEVVIDQLSADTSSEKIVK